METPTCAYCRKEILVFPILKGGLYCCFQCYATLVPFGKECPFFEQCSLKDQCEHAATPTCAKPSLEERRQSIAGV